MSFSLFPSVAIPSWLSGILQSIWTVWGYTWWIVLPLIAMIIFWEAWLLHLHHKFISSIKWTLLELKVPRDVLKTPKAMEQIFATAHAPYSYGIRFYEKYIKGIDEYWFSFEIVARAGETHFYLRTPEQFRNMLESAIYAQYPEAEITEVEDYLETMPHVLPNKDIDISGFEEILRHEPYLPIRTYLQFEDQEDERRLDPIAHLMEAMGKLEGDEQLWVQLLIRPTGEEFKEEGEEAVRKIMGLEEKEEKGGGIGFDLGFSLGDAVGAPFRHPGLEPREHKEEKSNAPQGRIVLTPGEKEIVEGVQMKVSKLAFEATYRFLYINKPATGGSGNHLDSIHGYVRQFNTQHLNSLRPDKATTPASYAVRGLFKKTRIHWRKRLLWEHYRHILLSHGAHHNVLNIEELATLFHFPISTVRTSELEKIESRKGSPPATLPVIEE